jgi:glycosyltransferase involved in cell wall biosynthesis
MLGMDSQLQLSFHGRSWIVSNVTIDRDPRSASARRSSSLNFTSPPWPLDIPPKRADLHCHSDASNEADEALLNSIQCPESFSAPLEVFAQAMRSGMDFITLTDHDSLAGVEQLLPLPGVLSGEELTCYFPEDHCKIHLLVWGLTAAQHEELQAAAEDIYTVADIVASERLAHSVAHPLYRQNDRLELWHLQRLILLFKGFETLNGAHSPLHRQSVEPLLDDLTTERVAELAALHRLPPHWPQPHVKSRTGGSDDHGLFNIGRTWTEFPGDVRGVADLLECLRQGRCRPGGEAGSSLKLAHNFFGVGIRYYGRKLNGSKRPANMQEIMLRTLIGERRAIRRRDWVRVAVQRRIRKIGARLKRPFVKTIEPTGSALLLDLVIRSFARRARENPAINSAIRNGTAALAEHAAMFDLLAAVNRDVTAGIADSMRHSVGRGEVIGLFDSLSTVASHQFLLLPYYFAMFHQNRERRLMTRLTGRPRAMSPQTMRLGVFTDTFDEINGVSRFIADISGQARRRDRSLVVHTCSAQTRVDCPSRRNFTPLLSMPMPKYPDQNLVIPPLAEVMEFADRQQFDAIHVHTPGPMGLCGLMVARMLRIPVLATYHTDFPRYVRDLTGDHRLTTLTTAYMKWFYGQTRTIFSRSKDYCGKLAELGLGRKNLAMALPGVDTEKFSPDRRDPALWEKLGVNETYKLLYAGRVSVEKNLPFLVETFRQLCGQRSDVALVIAGDGPYRAQMEKAAAGLPVHFLGFLNDEQLAALYASSDLFVFPSKTDTLGQVVVEAQAAGLPVLVSDQGGPRELMDEQITGQVLPAQRPEVWRDAIDALLNDHVQRQRMARTAPRRAARFSQLQMFEAFWAEHCKAAAEHADAAMPAAAAEPAREEAIA